MSGVNYTVTCEEGDSYPERMTYRIIEKKEDQPSDNMVQPRSGQVENAGYHDNRVALYQERGYDPIDVSKKKSM